MHSVPERRVLGPLACDVESIGLAECRLVAVRRSCQHDHAFAGPDGLPADHRLALRDSEIRLHRAVVTQDLVDRVARPAGLLAQPLHLLRMAHERPESVPDEVRRRLVAGDHDHAEHVGRFGGVDELCARGFAREGADRIVALAACPFGEALPEVRCDALARDVCSLALAARCDHLQEPRPIGGPALPPRLLVLGNAEHAQHHPHRERLCDLADPLHVPAPCRPLHDLVGQRLDRGVLAAA